MGTVYLLCMSTPSITYCDIYICDQMCCLHASKPESPKYVIMSLLNVLPGVKELVFIFIYIISDWYHSGIHSLLAPLAGGMVKGQSMGGIGSYLPGLGPDPHIALAYWDWALGPSTACPCPALQVGIGPCWDQALHTQLNSQDHGLWNSPRTHGNLEGQKTPHWGLDLAHKLRVSTLVQFDVYCAFLGALLYVSSVLLVPLLTL